MTGNRIRFNAASAEDELRARLLTVLKTLQQQFLAEARAGMQTPEGAQSLTEGDLTVMAGWMAAGIVGGAWAAMDEFGTGSQMDTSNPALTTYRDSGLWNPLRRDTAIRGRPAGPYTNIFGETVVSSGRMAGLNLERKGRAEPQPPSRAIRNAARWLLAESVVQTALTDVLRRFPWRHYLVVTPGR